MELLCSAGFMNAAYLAKDISKEINEQLKCEVVFRIPVPFIKGGIPVFESTVVTWAIIAIVTILSVILTRNLKVVPGRRQIFLETCVGWIRDFCRDNMGKHGMRYFPYLGTVLIYIGCANIAGLFGVKPPTKDMSVTIGLALMSIILIEYANIHRHGFGGFLKSFGAPMPLLLPMNILEIGIRPLSLCMRLFGNVVAAFIIMELIKMICPVALPLPFSCYFDLFDGCLQAYIFVFLTSLFIQEAVE